MEALIALLILVAVVVMLAILPGQLWVRESTHVDWPGEIRRSCTGGQIWQAVQAEL